MRNPIRSIVSSAMGVLFSFLAIAAILLIYNFLHAEYAKFEAWEYEHADLHAYVGDLEKARDKFAKTLSASLPQRGEPLNLLAGRIKALETEISTKQATRQDLWNQHPLDRKSPLTSTYRQIALLDMEIAFLQQGLVYVRNLHDFGAGPLELERQIKLLQADSVTQGEQIYQNRKAQWDLSKREALMWQVPFTAPYRKMKKLEAEERSLKMVWDNTIAQINEKSRNLQTLRNRPSPGPLTLDFAIANLNIQQITDRLSEIEKNLEGSSYEKFFRPAREVLPTAFTVLLLALISPLLAKGIAYFLIAPIATRCPPVRLLPEASGKLSKVSTAVGSESGSTVSPRVTLALFVDEQSELLIMPEHLQGMPVNAQSDTRWLLDWTMPLTSLIAGMYRLTRIRPNSEERITVSSSIDPLAEFSLIDVPACSALVLQPHSLVGLIQPRSVPVKVTRHWRLGTLAAWLTLQFRYIVFHGPAKLIVKGCRGVRVEPASGGRTVNQASTLGFSANLDYSVGRNETFWAYYFGERELFNDTWRGDGCYVQSETANREDRSGIFGRGLQGIVDTFLKIFGI